MTEKQEPLFTCSKKDVAMLYGKTLKTIDDWIVHGMPVYKSGKPMELDLSAVIRWRERYVLGSDAMSAQQEKAGLDKARRLKAELEYKKLLGNVLDVNVVEKVMTELITNAVTKLKSLPTKMAPIVFGCKSLPKAEAEIRKQLYECITELREFDASSFIKQDTGSVENTSGTDDKRMGGRKKNVKSGSKRRTGKVANR